MAAATLLSFQIVNEGKVQRDNIAVGEISQLSAGECFICLVFGVHELGDEWTFRSVRFAAKFQRSCYLETAGLLLQG